MSEFHEGEKESWNMAQATMKRLNNLLNLSSFYAQGRKFDQWFQVLMDLRRNLAPFLDDAQFEEATKKLGSLPKDWNLGNGRVHPNHHITVNRIFDEVYIIFINCMKSKGLLMPKTMDTGKSIIEM